MVIAVAVTAAALPIDARFVERWYSTGIYPQVQRVVTPLSNLLPFALFDLLTLAAFAFVVVVIVRGIRAARRTRRWGPFAEAAATIVTFAAAVYLVFLGLWGLNYRRVPMPERLVLDRPAPSSAAVMTLGMMAVDRMNSLHGAAHQEGFAREPHRDGSLRDAYGDVQAWLSDARPAVPGRLKASLYGLYFRWSSVDGMVDPFALEVIRNPDLLPWELPFIAAHEWAHLAGFADESEANFVGWLTCLRGNVAAQYSAWMFLYWQIAGESSREDREQMARALAAGPRRDVAAVVDRIQRGQLPLLRDASWRVYDQYLRANRVEEGVRSYGAVLTLILRARFEDGWVPVRRE